MPAFQGRPPLRVVAKRSVQQLLGIFPNLERFFWQTAVRCYNWSISFSFCDIPNRDSFKHTMWHTKGNFCTCTCFESGALNPSYCVIFLEGFGPRTIGLRRLKGEMLHRLPKTDSLLVAAPALLRFLAPLVEFCMFILVVSHFYSGKNFGIRW